MQCFEAEIKQWHLLTNSIRAIMYFVIFLFSELIMATFHWLLSENVQFVAIWWLAGVGWQFKLVASQELRSGGSVTLPVSGRARPPSRQNGIQNGALSQLSTGQVFNWQDIGFTLVGPYCGSKQLLIKMFTIHRHNRRNGQHKPNSKQLCWEQIDFRRLWTQIRLNGLVWTNLFAHHHQ